MLPLPKGAVWQAFLVLCLVLLVKEANAEARVVCYYTNWSVYRPGTAKFNPQNINPYLCTHLIYAFGGFTKDNTLKPFDKYQDIEQGGYAKFTGLKSYNKQLKTMLAIGGWNEASSRFSPLVANPDRRQQFIRNILKFLRQNHFDGLDLDWEYPAFRDGGKPRDRDNYAQFVEELRSEFDRESSKTGRPRLLLTMAVPAGIEYIEKGYDVPKLNQYLDWFNILSYDYHSAFEPSVNHHAPLYSLEEPSEYNYDVELNIDYTVKFYLEAGADRDKLVLGIPTYGRSYTLINDEDTEIGAPADGPGEQGEATREKGYLAYYEICQSINEDPTWTVVQPNDKAMGPYAYRGNQWVGYDDENIARKKAQYVAENGLGGIMFWSLDNDDFRGTCTGRQYPLIEAAKEALLEATGFGANEVSAPARPQKASRPRSRAGSSTTRNRITEHTKITKESNTSVKHTSSSRRKSNKKKSSNTPRTTTTTTTVGSLYIGGRTTTPPPPTTPDPGADFKCEEEGFFPHPRDCKKYFWCLDSGPSNLGIVAHQFTCPSGLYFNTAADSCDFTRNVVCKKPSKETTTPRTTASTTTTTTTTTTSAPKRITAATSSYSYIQRTSTTAEPEDDDEEEEYEDEEDGDAAGHEEDPKVIKELIELIKRVGGLEELEKQLQLQEDGTVVMKNPKNDEVSTTPSSISQSLYAKVLSRPNPLSSLRNRLGGSKFTAKKEEISTSVNEESSSSKYTSVNRNSRPSPQNAGIDKLAEFEGFLKDKPKYVTINRTRPTKSTGPDIDEPKELTEEEENADAVEVEDTSEANAKRTSSSYVNIRRTRPTKSADTLVEKSESELEVNEAAGGQSSAKTQYQTINRVRGTAISSGTDELVEEEEVSENTKSTRPKSTYQTLTRTKTTTSEQTEGENKEAELQVQSKVEYQSFTRTRNTTTSAIQDDNAAESEDETSNKRKTRPTYQSFTRTRGTTVANTDEIEKEETGDEQNVRTKQTYQSLSRFRPSTSASTAEEEVEETGGQTRTRTRISPTASSDQQPGKTRGTTVATSSVDKSEAEEVQKKNRYSLFTRRQSTVGLASEAEDINELAPTEPTISSRTRGTTVSSSSVVEDEIVLKSVGSTNRFQIYNRTRPTSPVDTAPITSLTLEEAEATLKTLEDDTIPTITVQYSDPSLANTTPISAPQDQEIPSVTPDYTNIVRRSTTTTTPSAPLTSTSITATTSSPQTLSPETSPPDLSQPSIETVTQNSLLIELSDPSSTDPITLTPTPNIEVSSVSPTEVVFGGLLEKSADQNEVASKDSLPIISTAPALDTVEIAQNQVSELNSVSSSNSRQDTVDKVTLVTGEKEVGVEAVERQGLVEDSELTRTNSKFESSLNNVNSESSLSSNVDSEDSVLIITRTTSTTTSRPAFSSPTSVRQSRPTASTSRFNTRRRPTQSTTSTTTTEEPEEFVSILSSPRPFSLPSRRRTRPSRTRTKTTTETSLDVSEPTSRSRSTTRTREYQIDKRLRKLTDHITTTTDATDKETTVVDRGTTKFASRNTTGIFSSEGYVTRVNRKELIGSTQPTTRNKTVTTKRVLPDSKVTYIRTFQSNRESTKQSSQQVGSETVLTRQNSDRKGNALPVRTNTANDLNGAGSGSYEEFADIDDEATIRTTLIFLKGPTPSSKVSRPNGTAGFKFKLPQINYDIEEEEEVTGSALGGHNEVGAPRGSTKSGDLEDDEEDEPSKEEYDDYQSDEEDEVTDSFLSRLLSSMKRIFSNEETDEDTPETTTRKYVTITRPKVTTESADDAEPTTPLYAQEENEETTSDSDKPGRTYTTLSRTSGLKKTTLETKGNEKENSSENTNNGVKETVIANNGKGGKVYSSINRVQTSSVSKDSTSSEVSGETEEEDDGVGKDSDVIKGSKYTTITRKNNASNTIVENKETDIEELDKEEGTTVSYSSTQRAPTVSPEEEKDSTKHIEGNIISLEEQQDLKLLKVSTATSKYVTVTRNRVSSNKTESETSEDDFEEPGISQTEANTFTSEKENFNNEDEDEDEDEDEEKQIGIAIASLNSNSKEGNGIKNIVTSRRVYSIPSRRRLSTTTEALPNPEESTEKTLAVTPQRVQITTRGKYKFRSSTSTSTTEIPALEDEENTGISSQATLRPSTRGTFTFRTRNTRPPLKPTVAVEEVTTAKTSPTTRRAFTFRTRSKVQTTTAAQIDQDINQDSPEDTEEESAQKKTPTTRRSFVIRKRVRPVVASSKNEESEVEAEGISGFRRTSSTFTRTQGVGELSEHPISPTRRTYGAINRIKATAVSTTEELEEIDEEEEEETEERISSTTRRTYGFVTRRKLPVKPTSDSSTDFDEEEEVDHSNREIQSTTRRSYASLNRKTLPIGPKTERPDEVDDEEDSEEDSEDGPSAPEISVTTRRTYGLINRARFPTRPTTEETDLEDEADLEEEAEDTTLQPKITSTTRKTYSFINKSRLPSAPTTKEPVKDYDEDKVENTQISSETPSTTRRTFSFLNRAKLPTRPPTEEPAEIESDEEIDDSPVGLQVTTTTRRTYGILNRPKPFGRPSTTETPEIEEEDDIEDDSASIKTPSTTRRTYGILNRNRFTTKPAAVEVSEDDDNGEGKEDTSAAPTTKRTPSILNRVKFLNRTLTSTDSSQVDKSVDDETNLSITSRRNSFLLSKQKTKTASSVEQETIQDTNEEPEDDSAEVTETPTQKPLIATESASTVSESEDISGTTMSASSDSTDPILDEMEVTSIESIAEASLKLKDEEDEGLTTARYVSDTKENEPLDITDTPETPTTLRLLDTVTPTPTPTQFTFDRQKFITRSTTTAPVEKSSTSRQEDDEEVSEENQTTKRTFTPIRRTTTTTTQSPVNDENEDDEESIIEASTRRTFTLLNRKKSALSSTSSKTDLVDENEEKEEEPKAVPSTTRRAFGFSRPTTIKPKSSLGNSNEPDRNPASPTRKTYGSIKRVQTIQKAEEETEDEESSEQFQTSKTKFTSSNRKTIGENLGTKSTFSAVTRRTYFGRPSSSTAKYQDDEEEDVDESEEDEADDEGQLIINKFSSSTNSGFSPTKRTYNSLNRIKVQTLTETSTIRQQNENSETTNRFSPVNRPRSSFSLNNSVKKGFTNKAEADEEEEYDEYDDEEEEEEPVVEKPVPVRKFGTFQKTINSKIETETIKDNSATRTKFAFPTRTKPILGIRSQTAKPALSGEQNESDEVEHEGEQHAINSQNKFSPTSPGGIGENLVTTRQQTQGQVTADFVRSNKTDQEDEESDEYYDDDEELTSEEDKKDSADKTSQVFQNSFKPLSSVRTKPTGSHPIIPGLLQSNSNIDSNTPTLTVTTNNYTNSNNNLTNLSVNGPNGNSLISKQLVGVAIIDDNNDGNNTQSVVDVNVDDDNGSVNIDFSRPLLLNFNRRFQNITSSRRGGYNQVNSTTRSSSTRYNSTTATVSPTDDVQNITSSTVSGRRRVAIFRVRRPVNGTNISNVGRGNVARTPNKDLGDNENRDSDSTSTQQTLTSTTESSTAPRRFTVRRKLIRKRPVENSATTLPSAGSGISSETGSTRFDENVNISETEVPRSTTALPTTRRRKTSTVRPKAFSPSRSSVGDAEDKASSTTESPDDLVPTRRFRKVIRRLKKPPVNASTTVVPVLKFVPQTDGRIHLLKVGEEAKNQTVEDEEIVSKVLLDVKESVRSFDPESTTLELEQRFNHTTLSNTLEVSSEEPTTQKVETETIRDYELETNGTHPLDPIETIDETANITVTDEEELRIKLLSEGEFNLTRPLETTPLAPTPTITEAPVLPEEGESPAINDTSITAATEPSSEISNTTIIPDDVSNTTIPGEDIGENATIIPPTSSDVSQNLNDTSSTESTSTTTTTKSKLFASRRPYKPTKPSISAITSTEATSPTPKSYVRKYSTNFTSIKSPADIDNPVGIIIPKVPSVLKQTPNKYRLKSTTARTTPSNGDEANDAEEEEYDEYTKVEEEDGDAPHKIALIKPNYVLINRTPKAESHLEENPQQGLEANEDEEEDDSEEEDYDEEEKITQLSKSQIPNMPHPIPPVHSNQPNSPVLSLGIPAIPPVLVQPNSPIDLLKMVLAPGQLPPPIPAVSLNTATESGAVVRLNNGFVGVLQKSESKEDESDNDTTTPSTTTTRRHPTHRITRPSNKPRVVNRPFVTTIHPASLRLAVTSPPKPTTPAPFRTNSTRNYERKYTASSSTESTLSDNSLLEDLNIDALNARNKKIFQETSRKHTTVKPKTTQKDGVEYNITGYTNETESESYYTTQLHNFDSDGEYVGDDVNGFNQFQENVLENSQHSPATPIPPTSTTSKMTTLHHVFELSEEDHTTTAPGDTKDYVHTVMTSDPRKLVEINRIVEIYSKQNVYKINVNNHTTQNISSTELKLEKLPRVDHIGEISRAALVNLVDSTGRARSEETHGRSLEYQGSNVLIEGRSTVADYKPTEEIPVTEFTPVRNSIPEYQNDQGARAGKVNRHPFVPDVLSGVETSTISLEGLFEFTRKSKSGRVINSPVFATSLGEVRPNVIHEVVRSVNSPQQATTSATLATTEPTVFAGATTFAPEIPTQTPTPVSTTETPTTTSTPPTTTTIGPIQTTERPTAKTEKSINYVRPLVPLLRPESNESSPLVISIANLDKVTLSKVPRDGSVASSGRVRSQLKGNGRRPVLSVRRRITPAPNSTAPTVSAEDSGTPPHVVDSSSPTTVAASTISQTGNDSGVTAPTTSFTNRFNRNRVRFTTTPTTSTTEQPSAAPRVVIRRKFARPVSIRRITTTTTTSTPATVTASHNPTGTDAGEDADDHDSVTSNNDAEHFTGQTARTVNFLIRRRFSTTTPIITTSAASLDVELADDPEIDQEAGSSQQDTKFTNHRFNQIGENLDNEDDRKLVEAIKVMSRAPPPIGKEEAITRRIGAARTTLGTTASTSSVTMTTTRRTIIRRPQKTTQVTTPTPLTTQPVVRRRKPQKPQPFEKVNSRQFAGRTYRPIIDYDYYDDDDVRFVSKSNSQVKVILHGRGIIECLDQGNFPHPLSCKKFISCAKMETGGVVGWEYTCPKGLSYDPVGGICNWAAGLGCKD